MTHLEVVTSGVQTLIQDLGRFGVGHIGLSQGGPADLHAYCWANRLLGNDSRAPVLEITLGQVAFKAKQNVMLAVTGANMPLTIDGQPVENWQTLWLEKGQVLKFGYARQGFRCYLAIESGFDVPRWFGSASTVVRNGIGGLENEPGRALSKGDELTSVLKHHTMRPSQAVASRYVGQYPSNIRLGVLETYQHTLFSEQQKAMFYQSAYTVSDKSDRMGVRLQGRAIHPAQNGVISEGIAPGSIQFPANGQPIILSNDRQTLGGYPKLGCLSKMSLMRLGQARPGVEIEFYPTDLAQERLAYRQFAQFFGL